MLPHKTFVFGVVICMVVVVGFLSGCSPVPNSPAPSNDKPAIDQPSSSSTEIQPTDSDSGTPAPTHDAVARVNLKDRVSRLVDEAEDLCKRANAISYDPRVEIAGDMHWQFIGDEIQPWRKREEVWKSELESCGADILQSTAPSERRLMPVTENLTLCENWLWQSADKAAHCSSRLAQIYVKAARASSQRARAVFTGKIKSDSARAVMSVPSYISKADEEQCQCPEDNSAVGFGTDVPTDSN
jgi:hypothetical protein